MKTNIGGERLGSGSKLTVDMKTYNRSSHDIGYVWRSTMASGTLVPFMSEIGLPGDTMDIDIDVDVMTHPTIGPLFGSYKIQLDVFKCPIRLYQGALHMNLMGIGLDMSKIKLPQIVIKANGAREKIQGDNSQINASALLSYLNIRGVGRAENNLNEEIEREFNAIPTLAYWDIYKQYYANKQEEIGVVIHNDLNPEPQLITGATITEGALQYDILEIERRINKDCTIKVFYSDWEEGKGIPKGDEVVWQIGEGIDKITILYPIFGWDAREKSLTFSTLSTTDFAYVAKVLGGETPTNGEVDNRPRLTKFPLENIDEMKVDILKHPKTSPLKIDETTRAPYGLMLKRNGTAEENRYSKQSTQEGLGIKTYQSDIFNNWMNTEYIDGDNGVNAITSVDTSEGSFSIDTLNLSRKVYDMLNRIAMSGGSYDDWLDAVYTHERARSEENPVYMGGLIRELVFQEVVSNAAAGIGEGAQPLGTLAGRGTLSGKKKGGNIRVKIDEPSYVIGIVSLTPRLDYSQGNKWDNNLKTLNDLHKPALDEIGFQSLITDGMAWFDTEIQSGGEVKYREAGKVPAWLNYMTNVNQVRGNFADENQQMFMTLNRKYEQGTEGILDLTTYIDPSKFNHIFADTRIDAQNFWTQIRVNNTARRKMSSKIMPNL